MENLHIQHTEFKISDFLNWQRNNQLQLSPSFQRRPVWTKPMKSYFIDTIVRGLPVPIIFIREQTDLETLGTIRQVVDGQQRLRTVLSYIEPNSLKNYNFNKDFFQVKKIHNEEIGNKNFSELSKEIKQRILDYQFSVHVLPSDINDQQVLQIFARMNSTGVKLNNQELRNAQYFGEFKQTVYKLALEQLDRWRNWSIFTESDIARMKEVEATSDLVLLIMKGVSTKNKSNLDRIYKEYEDQFSEKKITIERFQTVMDSIEEIIGREMKMLNFRKETIFYYLFVLVYDLSFSLNSKIISTIPKRIPLDLKDKIIKFNEYFEENQYPSEIFKDATRRPNKNVREKIYEYLLNKL